MNSNSVATNQTGLYASLEKVVRRHLISPANGPIHEPTRLVFEELIPQITHKKWILDSGCGVGLSSVCLAEKYPEHLVVGVDQSLVRLSKTEQFAQDGKLPQNLIFIRAELNDLWRLLAQNKLIPEYHFVLYPNPWPKSKHFQRRFQGCAAFAYLLEISPYLELRSNWLLYLEEFDSALTLAGRKGQITTLSACELENPLTLFEQKFFASGQELYRLVCSF